MALIVTPGHLTQRAAFYHQLSQMTSAGLGVIQSLDTLLRSPPSRKWRPPLRQLLDGLQGGQTLAQALTPLSHWFADFESAILGAAEQSGRLPESFLLLARHYEEKMALARQFIGLVVYPVLVLHLAVLIFPTTALQGLVLQGQVLGFVVQKAAMLLPLYLVCAVLLFLFQETRSKTWRALLESFLHMVPVLGAARRALALARLSAALEALVNAGVPILQAWDLAAPASGSPALVREVRRLKARLQETETPGEAIQRARVFPVIFANQYASGELSGKLDENLRWLQRYYEEEGSRKLRRAIVIGGSLLYFGVVLIVAWQVISFYVGYFKQIEEVIPR